MPVSPIIERESASGADFGRALDWHDPDFAPRPKRMLAGTALYHLLAAAFFAWGFSQPAPSRRLPEEAVDVRKSVKLVAPVIRDLTQKDPNRGKPAKEVDIASLQAKASPKLTPAPPRLPRPSGGDPAPRPAPPEPRIEAPPQISQTAPAGTTPQLPQPVIQVPPPAPSETKPKLAFETPGVPTPVRTGTDPPKLTPPKSSVEEAVRAASRPGAGGVVVGDADEGSIPSPFATPSQAKPTQSALELLSDPLGVDFKPYLVRVLALVRRNWLAVVPESARLGRRGRVVIQFAVARDGRIPKLVIATPSGTEALDRAAVAGISASTPLPALPPEFKGDQVRLQLSFSYNLPTR